MTSPIDRMIDAAVACMKCGTPGPPGSCGCWIRCRCGWWKAPGKPCGNEARHDDHDAATIACQCSRPFDSRRACGSARSLKTPCRCNCHAAGIRRAHARLRESGGSTKGAP